MQWWHCTCLNETSLFSHGSRQQYPNWSCHGVLCDLLAYLGDGCGTLRSWECWPTVQNSTGFRLLSSWRRTKVICIEDRLDLRDLSSANQFCQFCNHIKLLNIFCRSVRIMIGWYPVWGWSTPVVLVEQQMSKLAICLFISGGIAQSLLNS